MNTTTRRTDWSPEPPDYPGYWWGYTQHGTVELVLVTEITVTSGTRLVFTPMEGNLKSCVAAKRWQAWLPLRPPASPVTSEAVKKVIGAELSQTAWAQDPILAALASLGLGSQQTVTAFRITSGDDMV